MNAITKEFIKVINGYSIEDKYDLIEKFHVDILGLPRLKSGCILYRPLSFLDRDFGKALSHYGIVFGTDRYNGIMILEMNKSGVCVVSLKEFLGGQKVEMVNYKIIDESIDFNAIFQRAIALQFKSYRGGTLNCQHFVNYCIYGSFHSVGIQKAKKVVVPILNIGRVVLYNKWQNLTSTKDIDLRERLNNSLIDLGHFLNRWN